MALKEIRLEHEEGAPCTAIREGGRLAPGLGAPAPLWGLRRDFARGVGAFAPQLGGLLYNFGGS